MHDIVREDREALAILLEDIANGAAIVDLGKIVETGENQSCGRTEGTRAAIRCAQRPARTV